MTTTFPVGQLAYPTATQIRDQILLDLGFYGERVGIVYNTKPGSDYYKLATALANRVAIAIANNQLSNDARNPLIAEGTALLDICRAYGLEPRPASGSAGSAIVKTSTLGATIPAGWRATAPNGKKYDVSATTTVANGDTISIVSVATGSDTELAAGTQLTWDSAAIATLLNPLTVDGDGITGGTDTDDEEDMRRRLLDRLRSQAVGGNAASIKGWAEEVSAQIERAFVYQGVRGPCTIDFAVTRESTDRTVNTDIVDQARANVISQLPGGSISVVGTTVVPEPLDVVIELGLPLPATAGGTGSGWRDANPWPTVAIVKVTNVAGAILTVNGSVSPTVGNNIGLWDRSVEPPVMRERRILTVSGSSGAWTLTVDGSTSFVEVGDIVSAGAFNLPDFAEVIRLEFADLGPGEKTDDDSVLPRAARYPNPELQQPANLTSRQLTALQAEHPVIFDLAWFARYETGTTTTRTEPSLPPAPADPPRNLTIENLAFVRKSP